MDIVMNYTRLLLAGLPLLTITACSQQALTTANTTASTDVSAIHTLQTSVLDQPGEQALFSTHQRWLSIGPDNGLTLTRQSSERIEMPGLRSEYLDYRPDDDQYTLVLLNPQNRLQRINLGQNGVREVVAGDILPWAVEGLCLYQPPQQTSLQVFVLDDRAMAHQLLLEVRDKTLDTREIRQFPLPPGSEFCSVDDATSQLFVSEDSIGVWAYNARPESEVRRYPVELVKPWGQLQHNSGPLATINGQLLIGEYKTNLLHRYQVQEQGALWQADYRLPADLKLKSLTVASDAKADGQSQLQLGLLDNSSKQLFHTQLQDIQDTRPAHDRIAEILPDAETTPVSSEGDAADDPAIWVNHGDPANSRVLGTNKQQGLLVYDLDGKLLQSLPAGRVNNVDVRQGFSLRGKPMDIASASQRERQSIALFAIDPVSGTVTAAGELPTSLDAVYGLCMYQQGPQIYVFINDQDGRFQQYEITDSQQGWRGQLVREFAVGSQPEGCSADDRQQRLFLGEEDVAVWSLSARADASTKMVKVAAVGDWLHDDIEGMDIYQTATENWLVVSSQGNDSYVIFDANPPFAPIGRFRVGLNARAGVDGSSETDGLTISSQSLGPQYPHGMLVVQDGRNLLPDAAQNFKYIDWRQLQPILKSSRNSPD
jgi:3-phytase